MEELADAGAGAAEVAVAVATLRSVRAGRRSSVLVAVCSTPQVGRYARAL